MTWARPGHRHRRILQQLVEPKRGKASILGQGQPSDQMLDRSLGQGLSPQKDKIQIQE